MKKLSTKWFYKWSKKNKLSNQDMLKAIKDLEANLSTSDLGHHLYKVRIKRTYSGKSKGFRTIIVYKQKDRAVFLYGFGKNEKANITKSELKYFKKLSDDLLALTLNQLKKAIDQKILFDLEEIR
ncbi:MAG: hypothetical protein OMM_09137 [Candidatus Magnetoglobus multicellularis str. Araruama]|uniref:Type II toxin-antitoxin system RelE/ParE family toxin n=1 Tax=Candidatus Magnetoglobus multicellularis str. Araruama TaxID=890399 RepID=A0A1V1P5H5_9BACT|nr:MAG: hypothetical protein OMM_09137 [Candidatus Magnetoglobus multicellularis str. Araruama]